MGKEPQSKQLADMLAYAGMLNSFRNIERVIRANGEERWENDVEHSYHLAMLGWYIVSTEKLDLDAAKVLRYALIHDLVEVYAGDTYLYSMDEAHVASKETREREAQARLEKEFPHFSELNEAIRAYEEKRDAESRFVYALDKLQPLINIYLDNGRTWIEKKVGLEMIDEAKAEKIKLSPEVKVYYDLLMNLIKDHKKELFPRDGYEQAI